MKLTILEDFQICISVLLRKFNTELFCTYNNERNYYHHPYNHISTYTKYLFSGLFLREYLEA